MCKCKAVNLALFLILAATASYGAEGVADDLAGLVDPTAPLDNDADSSLGNLFNLASSFELNSILVRPNAKVAVINSRRVTEGELIGNARVVSIEKNAVTLDVAGESRVLQLYDRSIKSLSSKGSD